MEEKEIAKKQVPLRISASLWNDLSQWAEDDFRSINGQIEYLLTECVKQHKKNGGNVPKDLYYFPKHKKARLSRAVLYAIR